MFGRRTAVVVVRVVVLQHPHPERRRMDRLLDLPQQRARRVEALVVGVPSRWRFTQPFVEKLVRDHDDEVAAYLENAEPVSDGGAIVGDVLECVTAEYS